MTAKGITIEAGMKIKVNGKKYTVKKVGQIGFDLVGPRGGRCSVVRNIHNPDYMGIIHDGRWNANGGDVETIEKGW